ncbi:MAG: hypothetical protein HQL85_03760 [Magnetococcales bacterium]|nr:hypothetical protein [Magnetococcales bacterium]
MTTGNAFAFLRKKREERQTKARAYAIFPQKPRGKIASGEMAREKQNQSPGGNPPDPFFISIFLYISVNCQSSSPVNESDKVELKDCPQGFDLKNKVKSSAWKPFCFNSKTKSTPWRQSPRPLFFSIISMQMGC